MVGAVAVDLGATSGRFAAGRLVDGRIETEVIRQIPHAATERNGVLYWDTQALLDLCKDAVAYAAATFSEATVGIDSWGVDHGFLLPDGSLAEDVVCYRDRSHLAPFEALAPHRAQLYAATGCQHQPFNTICQLMARATENPDRRHQPWLILPDLLGYLMGGRPNYELTQASTTQLLGLDCQWSAEAFSLAGWPIPEQAPSRAGSVAGEIAPSVRLVHVGSHDTASAVFGFGPLGDHQAFLNVGTWSLLGCLLDAPIATPEAEAEAFTNERATDGRVRFLKNIPGFYVINRIHEELGVSEPVPQWLESSVDVIPPVDLMDDAFFNPPSMLALVAARAQRAPTSNAEWAGLAVRSLAATVANQPDSIERVTGRTITEIVVGGGGSQSRVFCEMLAEESRRSVRLGPVEATVLGNLATQFIATGLLPSRSPSQVPRSVG